MSVVFYPGIHEVSDAHRFERACVSINRLRARRKPIACRDVLIDSGAFSELAGFGRYREEPRSYAARLRRLQGVVNITAAVAQDYMCEPFMLAKTGLSVAEHQRLTIERYDALREEGLPFPIMPVLQGYDPEDYRRHVGAYGDRLQPGMWVGVGSVCKRNGKPARIVDVLWGIQRERPDLRLHGFGVKQTALLHAGVRELLYSADSMAWSYSARKQGRCAWDWRETQRFAEKVGSAIDKGRAPWQLPLL
jgi:hypothetical protein